MSRFQRQRRLILKVLVAGILVAWTSAARASDIDAPVDPDTQKRLLRLIEQLGDNRYTIRERAQAELAKLGFAAFEALTEAQHDDDIEIALRAQYLVRSMRIEWSRDTDPPSVKTILKGYEQLGVDQRVKRMAALSQLEEGIGTEALCRLVRFERTEALSKQAALLTMSQPRPQDDQMRLAQRETIEVTLGGSKRTAAHWLRVYTQWLESPDLAQDEWDRMVRSEEQLLTEFPDQTSRRIVRDLMRRQIEMLTQLSQNQLASESTKRLFTMLNGSDDELLETADWLAGQSSWSMIVALAERFSDSYMADALLVYRLAQAHLQLGQRDKSQEAAQKALDRDDSEADKHVLTAYKLQNRGMFRWAEQEFRHVIKIGPAGSTTYLRAHFLLSEMLHDASKNLDAAELLTGVVKTMEKDDSARILAGRIGRQIGAVKSRLHYFYAQHFVKRNDRQQQREHLEKAIDSDPTDADVLIAMHRFPEQDEAWRKRTLQGINVAVEDFRRQIKEASEYPTAYNQLAWLVSNTEGDFDEALRCSHKSLELLPNTAGYLDTLGRCYYAKNDLKNAVKYQTQAVRLEPYSGQIRRQLDFFKQAQTEAQNE